MPKVQLIRRDGEIIELNATSVGFSVQRGVAIWAPPIVGVRMGLDLNNNLLSVAINGVIVDDENTSGSAAAAASFDLSRPTGLFDSWFKQQQAEGNTTIASIVAALHGKEITFRSAGQVAAGAGEDITLRFYSSSVPAATVLTNSMIPVNISGTINHTGDIATAMNTALAAASVKIATVTTAISAIYTITQGAGVKTNSGAHQAVGTLSNEKITLTNKTSSADGNGVVTTQGDLAVSSSQDWAATFHVTNFTGGVSGSKKSKGDKIQDLINMTVNASAGGGMLSPQAFTGDLIEMPDSLSNFDIAKLLMIEESDSVKKYIVGLRIPYDSMITASGADSEVIRQFVLPSGPGVDYSSEKNLKAFDPMEEGERPNPFFRQGVALAGVVQTFEPSYEAGDSVWTFSLGFACCEQLLGI